LFAYRRRKRRGTKTGTPKKERQAFQYLGSKGGKGGEKGRGYVFLARQRGKKGKEKREKGRPRRQEGEKGGLFERILFIIVGKKRRNEKNKNPAQTKKGTRGFNLMH